MNNVLLTGRLTKEVELRKTKSGKSVCGFTLAVQRDKETTDFINCVAWNMTAENMHKYCSKGDLVGVEGRITTRSYDAEDGSKRYITEVLANNVSFLNTKKEKQEEITDEFEPGNLDVEVLDDSDLLPF